MTINYLICTTHNHFVDVARLEKTIWDVVDADVITPHMLHVIHRIGGLILGAYDGSRMVGMAVATPMQLQGGLWSHMAGVLPEYQSSGIGYQMKQVQRDWALKHSYTEIHWSFDPAMRRNAKFNFHKLGVVTNLYHPNFYGMMTDGINAGVPSDRFEAIWRLNQPKQTHDIPDDIDFILFMTWNQFTLNKTLTKSYYAIACPYDFPAVKAESLDVAKGWRQMMGEAFALAFDAGYFVVDFVSDDEAQTCYYVLHRDES